VPLSEGGREPTLAANLRPKVAEWEDQKRIDCYVSYSAHCW